MDTVDESLVNKSSSQQLHATEETSASKRLKKILGIPNGGLPIHTNPSKETIDLMNTIFQTTNPTLEHLPSMISDNMPEEDFSRIFMLLALSTFLAPNSKGVPSKKCYSALVNIDSIPKYNWCLFALSFLVQQIKRMQSELRKKRTILPGGCKLILVIAHFEFLITSEFKVPTEIFPRLPLWSSTMLRSFVSLDTMTGVTQFSRLAMKHISATPFSDTSNELAISLPKSILDYINAKLPSILNIQEKSMVESISQKFWQTIIINSIPTLESYIDDVLSSFSLNIPSKQIDQCADSKVSAVSIMQLGNADRNSIIPKFPKEQHPDIQSFLSSINFLDFPGPHNYPPSFDSEYSKAVIDSLIQNFSESLFIENQQTLTFHCLLDHQVLKTWLL